MRRLILVVVLILSGCAVQPPATGVPAPESAASPALRTAPTSAPLATPTVVASQVIDPTLNFVLEVLRTTPTGETLYSWFLEVAPSLTFGVTGLAESWSGIYHEAPRNEIVINESLRDESPEVLAAVTAWQIVMAFNAKRDGLRERRWLSVEGCLNEAVAAETYMVRWWNEKFGNSGVPSPSTTWESSLNYRVGLHLNGTLGRSLRSSPGYQDFCAQMVVIRAPQDTSLPREILLLYFAEKLNRRTESADVQYRTGLYEYLTYSAPSLLLLYMDAGYKFVVADEFLFYASYLLVPDCIVEHLIATADDDIVQRFSNIARLIQVKWPQVDPYALKGVVTTAAEREEGCVAFNSWMQDKGIEQ